MVKEQNASEPFLFQDLLTGPRSVPGSSSSPVSAWIRSTHYGPRCPPSPPHHSTHTAARPPRGNRHGKSTGRPAMTGTWPARAAQNSTSWASPAARKAQALQSAKCTPGPPVVITRYRIRYTNLQLYGIRLYL
eukprot:3725405-Prymnesium_polylepis.1